MQEFRDEIHKALCRGEREEKTEETGGKRGAKATCQIPSSFTEWIHKKNSTGNINRFDGMTIKKENPRNGLILSLFYSE